MYAVILIIEIIIALISKLIYESKCGSINRSSHTEAIRKGQDTYYTANGRLIYIKYIDKDTYRTYPACETYIDGHKVICSEDFKTIYKDYTQEEIDKKYKEYELYVDREKQKALKAHKKYIHIHEFSKDYIDNKNECYFFLELSTNKRYVIRKAQIKKKKYKYYKCYHDNNYKIHGYNYKPIVDWSKKIEITRDEYIELGGYVLDEHESRLTVDEIKIVQKNKTREQKTSEYYRNFVGTIEDWEREKWKYE